LVIQVSNGKGLSHLSAKVSAIMEGIEHWHAENPEVSFRKSSAAELRGEGEVFVPATELPRWLTKLHLTDRRVVDWVRGEQLPSGDPIWLPACACFLVEPMLLNYDHNGLASGNHIVEATLHGLYEVIERHSMARLTRGGLSLPRGESRVINLGSLTSAPLMELRDCLRKAEVGLTLVRVESVGPVHTFLAVLVDPASPFACSAVNMGHGSHLSPDVAALRAITEAAQSRLTFIHGSREDLRPESYIFDEAHQRLRAFFATRRGDLNWHAIADHSSGDLQQDLETTIEGLNAAGYSRIYRLNMTNSRFAIPIVKVFVPGLAVMAY
jgi:ribosomal protein S12 methylthiotransferase accessory factor